MNERLKELAELAIVVDDRGYFYNFDREKFAELIIKECAQISISVDETMTGQGHASAKAFMEHIGVE